MAALALAISSWCAVGKSLRSARSKRSTSKEMTAIRSSMSLIASQKSLCYGKGRIYLHQIFSFNLLVLGSCWSVSPFKALLSLYHFSYNTNLRRFCELKPGCCSSLEALISSMPGSRGLLRSGRTSSPSCNLSVVWDSSVPLLPLVVGASSEIDSSEDKSSFSLSLSQPIKI